jgi:hypothetical protein
VCYARENIQNLLQKCKWALSDCGLPPISIHFGLTSKQMTFSSHGCQKFNNWTHAGILIYGQRYEEFAIYRGRTLDQVNIEKLQSQDI